MGTTCIYDYDEQCFYSCPGCVRAKSCVPDPDYLYDMERENELLEDD